MFLKSLISSSRVSTSLRTLTPRLFIRNYTKKNDDVLDEPIPYTKSMANKWQAQYSRMGQENDRLWYEPMVLLGSIGILLIYFCVLREENHIDQELNRSLYSRISGLEEHQLKLSLEHNLAHGKDTQAILKRLAEIEEEKRKN